jgi:hypothetical protein
MRRRAFPIFLILLLVFAMADDVLASFTADPGDDVLAAADNTYLSARPAHDQRREQGHPLPSLDSLAPSSFGLPAAVAIPASPDPVRAAHPTGDDRLYLLMSVQR